MDTTMERFAPLQKALFEDMTELLQKISDDPDNFGFALAVPTDYGAACILYAIGKNSALGPHGKHSEGFIFTPVQWVQDWTGMPRVNDALEEIVERFRETFSAMEDGDEKNRMHDEFISECAYSCLGILEECNRNGSFGNIWLKVLDMSDDEHPAVAESFRRLNSEKVQERGAAFFDY
jgi:hypothetical protein